MLNDYLSYTRNGFQHLNKLFNGKTTLNYILAKTPSAIKTSLTCLALYGLTTCNAYCAPMNPLMAFTAQNLWEYSPWRRSSYSPSDIIHYQYVNKDGHKVLVEYFDIGNNGPDSNDKIKVSYPELDKNLIDEGLDGRVDNEAKDMEIKDANIYLRSALILVNEKLRKIHAKN